MYAIRDYHIIPSPLKINVTQFMPPDDLENVSTDDNSGGIGTTYTDPIDVDIGSDLKNELNSWSLSQIRREPAFRSSSNVKQRYRDRDSCLSTEGSTTSSRLKTYFCDYQDCNKAFTRPSLLTQHQATVHQGMKPFECNQCERAFARRSHLERHLLSHLSNEEKPYHCSVCGKGVITMQQLRRHEITHTKSFECPYQNCNESFYKHPQLRSHILSVHLEKLTCKQCGKKFQRPYRLENHIRKHHNPDVATPYNCSFSGCLLSFKTWTQLTQHVKNDHPKLQCDICKKFVVGEDGLRMHMRIHDDSLVVKNWKCHLCKAPLRSFPKKLDLINHYREEHLDEKIPEELLAKQVNPVIIAVNKEPLQTQCSKSSDGSVRKRRKLMDPILEEGGPVGDDEDILESVQNEVQIWDYLRPGGKRGSSSNSDGVTDNGSSNTDRNSPMKLLVNTLVKKLRCPYSGCYRTFKTQERYNLHVERHKIHQLKLKLLEDKKKDEEAAQNQQKLEMEDEKKNSRN